jgi:hypothetical protein
MDKSKTIASKTHSTLVVCALLSAALIRCGSSGHEVDSGTDGSRSDGSSPQCALGGQSCAEMSCCSGVCTGGKCVCTSMAGNCQQGSDCCSGVCAAGVCADCNGQNSVCHEAANCCSGDCQGGVCVCAHTGAACQDSSGCCSANCSDGGICEEADSGSTDGSVDGSVDGGAAPACHLSGTVVGCPEQCLYTTNPAMCTPEAGASAGQCPSAGLVGCCVHSSGLLGEGAAVCYYASACGSCCEDKATCVGGGGTWQTTPPG